MVGVVERIFHAPNGFMGDTLMSRGTCPPNHGLLKNIRSAIVGPLSRCQDGPMEVGWLRMYTSV
jgi:hypothetical protein